MRVGWPQTAGHSRAQPGAPAEMHFMRTVQWIWTFYLCMLGSHVLRFADSSTHSDTPGGFVPTVHHILTRSDISIFDNSSTDSDTVSICDECSTYSCTFKRMG